MESFTWAGFGIGILETTIGVGLGFVLGLVAFHYQHEREKEAESEEAKESALDALNRVTQTAGLNIEALVNFKLQVINDLEPEVAKMKTAVNSYYDAQEGDREHHFHEMKAISAELKSFYKSLPLLAIMPAPDFREFSFVAQDMPALTTYLHRAMSTMQEINAQIRDRNSLIAGHALESEKGMTEMRFVYYASMISGHSDYLCQSVDNDLEFFKLTMEQVEQYMKVKNGGTSYLTFELIDKVKEALPKEDLFPELRKQMSMFDEQV